MSPHRINRSHNPRRPAARTLGHSLTLFSLLAAPLLISPAAQGIPVDPSRIIQYRGPMPLLPREHWGGEVELKFELYRSPDGGAPFWKETRTVPVGMNGWMKVDLGQVRPLPDEAFTTPFRFLSIWHDNVEFTPRKQIASLAYVALMAKEVAAQATDAKSLSEKPFPGSTGHWPVPSGDSPDGTAVTPGLRRSLVSETWPGPVPVGGSPTGAGGSPAPPGFQTGSKKGFDTLVDCGSFQMEAHPRSPTNWLAAVESARRLGGRLPTFEEWYGAYDGKAAHRLAGMDGHYEWVIPWVYEPTIHARLHELYRGKPVACYYEELSPLNDYQFRLVVVEQAAEATP